MIEASRPRAEEYVSIEIREPTEIDRTFELRRVSPEELLTRPFVREPDAPGTQPFVREPYAQFEVVAGAERRSLRVILVVAALLMLAFLLGVGVPFLVM
jgi:hypothetical protein